MPVFSEARVLPATSQAERRRWRLQSVRRNFSDARERVPPEWTGRDRACLKRRSRRMDSSTKMEIIR